MDQYIYLDDLTTDTRVWRLDDDDVMARLPEGYVWTWAGNNGAWCAPITPT